MNIQQLKVFVWTVKLQKLYLVANQLGIRQPTVTFHLNKLQEELGVPLFATKSYHVIRLTEAGNALFHYATRITSQAEEIESLMSEFRNLRGAKLAIGSTHTPATYILPPYLAELRTSYPHLSIMLEVKPAQTVIEKIKQFELDFGILTQEDLEDKQLFIQPLVRDNLVIVCYPDHPFTSKPELVPADLANYPFISHEHGSVSRRLLDEWAANQQVALPTIMEISGSEAMKEAVKNRMGYAVLSESLVKRDVEASLLRTFPIPEWKYERKIYLISERNKLTSPAMKIFLETVIARLKS